MLPKTLITNASERLSKEIITRLALIGEDVRAGIGKKDDFENSFHYSQVEKILLDMNDDASIQSSFQGVQVVVLVSSMGNQIENYVEKSISAAKKTGISHLIFISLFGVNMDTSLPFSWYQNAEKMISQSGLHHTIVRVNYTMQELVENIDLKGDMIFFPLSDSCVSFIDERDAAAAIAEIALSSEQHLYQSYNLTGLESLSMLQVAKNLSEIIGKKVDYVSIEDNTAFQALMARYGNEFQAETVLRYLKFLRSGKASKISNDITKLTNSSPVTMIDFMRDYAQLVRNRIT